MAHNLENLTTQNFCMTISVYSKVGHPQKFICKKFQNEGSLKILYLKNFPIYSMLLYSWNDTFTILMNVGDIHENMILNFAEYI